jgi:GntR family transcriptional regulator, transcriptional repressor for pyruvate dehydrogenase complex
MSNWGSDRGGRERTTAELVVDTVRGQIERGQLRAGQRLPPERELAARLGVSRPSVRTGLRTLVTMGILRTRHGSGTFVTDGPPRLDARALHMLSALHGFRAEHLDEARRLLEVAVAGLAAERAGGEQLVPLAEHVSGMFAAVEDSKIFTAHDAAFHRAIASAAGNPILASIVEMVTRLSFEQSRGLPSRSPEELRAVALLHRNIYHAVRSRDVERARREMAQHLPRPAHVMGATQDLAGAAS